MCSLQQKAGESPGNEASLIYCKLCSRVQGILCVCTYSLLLRVETAFNDGLMDFVRVGPTQISLNTGRAVSRALESQLAV